MTLKQIQRLPAGALLRFKSDNPNDKDYILVVRAGADILSILRSDMGLELGPNWFPLSEATDSENLRGFWKFYERIA